jgi:hypothetical protein
MGKLKLKFHDDVTTLESSSSMLFTDECSKAWNSFHGIKKATCQTEQEWNSDLLSYSYLVRIDEWSLKPWENNLFFHYGNPEIEEFSCDVSLLDQSVIIKPFCEITDVINSNLPGTVSFHASSSSPLSVSSSLPLSLPACLSLCLSSSLSLSPPLRVSRVWQSREM